MKIIRQLKFVCLILTAALVLCQAQNIRGSVESGEGEERDLTYYSSNGQKNNAAYRNYYNQGARNYGYGRYYRRYYGNGGNGGNGGNNNRRYYRQYNKYYQGGDDENAEQDDAVDDAAGNDDVNDADDGGYNPYDDDAYYNNSTHWYDGNAWVTKAMSYEEEAEANFWAWYATPPGEWTAVQWAWFSALMVLLIGISFCLCMCCSNFQEDPAVAKTRKQSEYDFDDYTSVDSKRSFMTSNSSADTEWDDNATYDSIMRLRSD